MTNQLPYIDKTVTETHPTVRRSGLGPSHNNPREYVHVKNEGHWQSILARLIEEMEGKKYTEAAPDVGEHRRADIIGVLPGVGKFGIECKHDQSKAASKQLVEGVNQIKNHYMNRHFDIGTIKTWILALYISDFDKRGYYEVVTSIAESRRWAKLFGKIENHAVENNNINILIGGPSFYHSGDFDERYLKRKLAATIINTSNSVNANEYRGQSTLDIY